MKLYFQTIDITKVSITISLYQSIILLEPSGDLIKRNSTQRFHIFHFFFSFTISHETSVRNVRVGYTFF